MNKCSHNRGRHVFGDWNDPVTVIYRKEMGSFGKWTEDHQVIQTRTCKLCGQVQSRVVHEGKLAETKS